MDIDKLDFLAVHAPDPKLTYGEVKEILGMPNQQYSALPNAEQCQLAEFIKRYEWARIMLKAKQISATRAASK